MGSPTRRQVLGTLSGAALTALAGCNALGESCDNRTSLRISLDPPPPTYHDELEPLFYSELPESEQQYVEKGFEQQHNVCTETSSVAQSFTACVERAVEAQGGSPWGGAPHIYLIRYDDWYDISLIVDGTPISF